MGGNKGIMGIDLFELVKRKKITARGARKKQSTLRKI
jgi:hypothetical protein